MNDDIIPEIEIREVSIVDQFSRRGYIAAGVLFLIAGILTAVFASELPQIVITFFGVLSILLGAFTAVYGILKRNIYGLFFPIGAGALFLILGIACTFFSSDILKLITWIISFCIFGASIFALYFWYLTKAYRGSVGFLIDGLIMLAIAVTMWVIGGVNPVLFRNLIGYFFAFIWFACAAFIFTGLIVNRFKIKSFR